MAQLDLELYELTLLNYTNLFENCRYDHISRDMGKIVLTSIQTNSHQLENPGYRNYGTYRHDIVADTSLVKINETYLKEKEITDFYYDPNNDRYKNMKIPPYIFDGVVLAKLFAVNANEASLEDIFVEYGYAYIQAWDTSYNTNNNGETYYFGYRKKDDNGNDLVPYSYSILPIGSKIKLKDDDGNEYEEEVLYDGTYVPTVEEILNGSLYIVISSYDTEPKKIYFNNKFMPTLFITDDKYPNYNLQLDLTLLSADNDPSLRTIYNITSTTDNSDRYILENKQTLKLCDLTLFERLGCRIDWENLILTIIKNKNNDSLNIYKIFDTVDLLYTDLIHPGSDKLISLDKKIIIYYLIRVSTKNGDNETIEEYWILTGNILPDGTATFANMTKANIEDYIDSENNIYTSLLLPGTTGVFFIGTEKKLTITLDIWFSLSLYINGVSLEKPTSTPVDPDDPDEPDDPDDNDYEAVFLVKDDEPEENVVVFAL